MASDKRSEGFVAGSNAALGKPSARVALARAIFLLFSSFFLCDMV